MPANLPPQAKAAERRYIEAKTLPDKIKYLQEFISTIPEHKGNEKMRGYLRRRLAQLKVELEEQKKEDWWRRWRVFYKERGRGTDSYAGHDGIW